MATGDALGGPCPGDVTRREIEAARGLAWTQLPYPVADICLRVVPTPVGRLGAIDCPFYGERGMMGRNGALDADR